MPRYSRRVFAARICSVKAASAKLQTTESMPPERLPICTCAGILALNDECSSEPNQSPHRDPRLPRSASGIAGYAQGDRSMARGQAVALSIPRHRRRTDGDAKHFFACRCDVLLCYLPNHFGPDPSATSTGRLHGQYARFCGATGARSSIRLRARPDRLREGSQQSELKHHSGAVRGLRGRTRYRPLPGDNGVL